MSIGADATCSEIIRIHVAREFRCRQISWRNTYAGDFVNPQWQEITKIDPLFVTYRIFHFASLVAATYFFSYTCANLSTEQKLKYALYFTNWTHVLLTITSLFAIFCLIYEYVFWHCGNQISHLVSQFPFLYRMYWILYSTSVDSAFTVSVGYWLYKPFSRKQVPLYLDMYHFWNSVLMLMDLFIVAIPVRLLHVYTSIIFAFIYVIFTICYEYTGHTDPHGKPYIYPVLRWKKDVGLAVGGVLVGLICLVVIRCVVFCLYKLRSWIFLKCYFEYELYTSGTGTATVSSVESLRTS